MGGHTRHPIFHAVLCSHSHPLCSSRFDLTTWSTTGENSRIASGNVSHNISQYKGNWAPLTQALLCLKVVTNIVTDNHVSNVRVILIVTLHYFDVNFLQVFMLIL